MIEKRYYLIDPKDGYPLGPYANKAEAEHVRTLDGRNDQTVKAMEPHEANVLRRKILGAR